MNVFRIQLATPAPPLLAALAVVCLTVSCAHTPKPSSTVGLSSGAVALTQFAAVAESNQFNVEWLLEPSAPFKVGPGDLLEIELVGEESSRATTLVGPDGKVYFHLLPGLQVWGLTLTEVKQLLELELLRYIRVPPPQVTVGLRSAVSKRVWILGQVGAPGIYTAAAPLTLLEAISMAGGPLTAGDTDLADLQTSFVMRQGHPLPVNFQRLLRAGDLSQNIYLQADDFIYLPPAYAPEVYVLGLVRQPAPVPFREEMTLVTAIAAAGGTVAGAALSHVAIVRDALKEPKIAIVDFGDIQKGRATDFVLEPRDIVYVPHSPFSFVWGYLQFVLDTFVRTVAVNEGIRAVSPVGRVQPNVSVP